MGALVGHCLREIPIKPNTNSALVVNMIPSPAPLIQKTQPMAGFLLFWEWKSVAPISGLTSYNEKARFSLAQRPALRRSAFPLWAGSKAYLATGRLLPVITPITSSDGSLTPTSESNISAMNFSITDNNNPFANFGIFSFRFLYS